MLDGYDCICALSLERNLSMHCGILPGSSRMVNPTSNNALRLYFVPRTALEVLYKSLIQSSYRFCLKSLACSVCWSLQCLISTLTQGAQWWSLFFKACLFSRALGREEHCKQISLACAHSDSATLGLPPLTVCVLSQSILLRL